MKWHPDQKTSDDTTQPALSLDPRQLANDLLHALVSNLIIEIPSGSRMVSNTPHRYKFSRVSVEQSEQACSMHCELRVNVALAGAKPDERILKVNLAVVNKEKLI